MTDISVAAGQSIHATSIVIGETGLLFLGPSGSGKSGAAFACLSEARQLGWNAALIADDRTILTQQGGQLIASCPDTIRGQIEARCVGILCATPAEPTAVALIVNLDHVERERLPRARQEVIMGQSLPSLHKCEGSHFPAALLQYLKEGRYD